MSNVKPLQDKVQQIHAADRLSASALDLLVLSREYGIFILYNTHTACIYREQVAVGPAFLKPCIFMLLNVLKL